MQENLLYISRGAEIVVTGRATDSALALAPLMHEFGYQLKITLLQLIFQKQARKPQSYTSSKLPPTNPLTKQCTESRATSVAKNHCKCY